MLPKGQGSFLTRTWPPPHTAPSRSHAMRRAVGQYDNTGLLAKSLAGGQISQVDYLQEVDRYYDMALRSLQMARDAELAKAELTAADL